MPQRLETLKMTRAHPKVGSDLKRRNDEDVCAQYRQVLANSQVLIDTISLLIATTGPPAHRRLSSFELLCELVALPHRLVDVVAGGFEIS